MRRRFGFISVSCIALVALVACGDGDSKTSSTADSDSNTSDTDSSNTSSDTAAINDTPLPAQCTLPPYTIHAVRDGELTAGSDTFQVVGAAAMPIPLVPDKDQTMTYEQSSAAGRTTDLLGYVVLFGDEDFGVDDVSLFGGYAPVAAGKSRGMVGIYPTTTTPLAVGDVLTPQSMDALNMYTTLSNLAIDFEATPDELMGYANTIMGSVTILGLNDSAICLNVDLSWPVGDISSSKTGTLTIQGILTAPLAERTLPFG